MQADTAQTQSIIAVAGTLLVVVIGDSLARAFGLVGLGTFIRFRAGVKDPRDVAVLFVMIGIGMACGLGLVGTAAVGTLFVSVVLAIFDRFAPPRRRTLTISVVAPELAAVRDAVRAAFPEARAVDVRREDGAGRTSFTIAATRRRGRPDHPRDPAEAGGAGRQVGPDRGGLGSMPLTAGSKLGPYEILSVLGSGGMGEVYRAVDPRLGREVAIKVLPAERMDEERRRRFVQEARAASALNHPNIVTIHEIESADGRDFIVMEYVAGKSLDRLIPRQGMPLGEALRIATPIADALARAHGRGIVHRDVKPSNVIVGSEGAVKLLDFGLAKLVASAATSPEAETETAERPLTCAGAVSGTVGYMSPEQASGREVDARTDVFSFGALLYEMVTGRRAFAGDSAAATLAAVMREQPKAPSEVAPDVPRDLERVILRCLRKEADRRYQSMADVKLELEQIKEDSDSQQRAGAAPGPRRRRR